MVQYALGAAVALSAIAVGASAQDSIRSGITANATYDYVGTLHAPTNSRMSTQAVSPPNRDGFVNTLQSLVEELQDLRSLHDSQHTHQSL